MQELVYCLSYILEHMDLMRNLVRIEGNVCVIFAARTVEVWVTFCAIAHLIHSAMHYF